MAVGCNRQVALLLKKMGEEEEAVKLLFGLHHCSKVCFSERDELTKLLAQDLLETASLRGKLKEVGKPVGFQKVEERKKEETVSN